MSETGQGERRARLRGALVRAGREEEASPALRTSLRAISDADAGSASVAPVRSGPDDTARRSSARGAVVSWKLYAVLAFAAGAAGGTLGVALATMAASTRAPAAAAIGDDPPSSIRPRWTIEDRTTKSDAGALRAE